MKLRLGLVLAAVTLAACAPRVRVPEGPGGLVRASRMPALADDGDRAALAAAARQSLQWYERLPPDRRFAFGPDEYTAAELRAGMEGLLGLLAAVPDGAALRRELERRFVPYQAAVPAGVLFTGYYLPTLSAQQAMDTRFRYPILRRPPNLVSARLADFTGDCRCTESIAGVLRDGRLEPYYTRAEIERGMGDARPLAWTDDDVALFFLQIQGSGTLVFPDGRRQMIGFDGSNGRPYVSIGKILIDSGRLAPNEASMEGIMRWAAAHPDEREALLHQNPRYVFFRPLENGAVGSIGVPVTPGRTIATDPAAYPPGALAWVSVPDAGLVPGATALGRLMLNQDAGAAIRGPGRVDLLVGSGTEAGAIAGRLKHRGELYFLAPRRGA